MSHISTGFLVLSLLASCKQGRAMWFDNHKVRRDQNLLGKESQRTIMNDSVSEWKGCNMWVLQ